MTLLNQREKANIAGTQVDADTSVVPVSKAPVAPAAPGPSILPPQGTQNMSPTVGQAPTQVDFNAVQQPQNEFMMPTLPQQAPAVTGQELVDQLGIPTYVPPSVDWDNVVQGTELFRGPARFNLDARVNNYLPAPTRNEVERAIYPNSPNPAAQSSGERMFDRGLGWLRRIQEGWGNGLGQDLDYGDYGTGLLGSLFYLLDLPTQIVRGSFLDTARLGFSLADATRRGGVPFSESWRREFSTTFRALDPTYDDATVDSYLWRAVTGNDLSPFNFRNNEYDNEYNPLGVLGATNTEFYDELDVYLQEHNADVEARETNVGAAWQQLTGLLNPRNPVVRRLPNVGLALVVDGFSDPLGPLNDLGNYMRRTVGRRVQTVAPAVPPPRTDVGSIVLRPRATSNIGEVEAPVRIGRAIRQRVNAGQSIDEALEAAAQLGAPSEQAIIRGMQGQRGWTPPRTTLITPPPPSASPAVRRALSPAPGFNDIARRPVLAEVGMPAVRTPDSRARIINSQLAVVPPGLTHNQVDQIVEALPATMSDELRIVSRAIGPEVPAALPTTTNTAIPRFLDDEGSEFVIQENVYMRRNPDRRIEIVPEGTINWTTYYDALPNLLQRNRGTYFITLPESNFAIPYIEFSYKKMGFTRQGDEMVYRSRPEWDDVITPFRRRPTNVVEMVSNNTQRPQGAYTRRVVRSYNEGTPITPPPAIVEDAIPVAAVEELAVRPPETPIVVQETVSDVVAESIPDAALPQTYSARGEWSSEFRDSPYSSTNAYSATPGDPLGRARDQYAITVERTGNNRWTVYAEDHEPSDLANIYDDYPIDGFKTRRAAREWAENFGQDLEDVWRQADIDEGISAIERRIGDTIEIVPNRNGQGFRLRLGRESDDVLSVIEYIGPRGGFPDTQAAEDFITANGDAILERVMAQQATDAALLDFSTSLLNPEQEAIDALINPSVAANPDAYDEVKFTMSTDIAPERLSPEAAEAIDVYTRLRNEVASSVTMDTDLRYQLSEIQDIDPEDFYNAILTDDPPAIEDVTKFMNEADPEVETLIQVYDEMLENPSTRNVQRYLSQLEFTVEARIEDNFNEATRQIQLMLNQEDTLREMADVVNGQMIEDQLSRTSVEVDNLVERIGRTSRGNCI